MVSVEPSGQLRVTGRVRRATDVDGTPAIVIEPESDASVVPFVVTDHGLGAELHHFVDERLTVRGRLGRTRHGGSARLLDVSSYGIVGQMQR
jgi:hypothetical protein